MTSLRQTCAMTAFRRLGIGLGLFFLGLCSAGSAADGDFKAIIDGVPYYDREAAAAAFEAREKRREEREIAERQAEAARRESTKVEQININIEQAPPPQPVWFAPVFIRDRFPPPHSPPPGGGRMGGR